MNVVGTAEHYAQFVRLARARIAELGITYDTVDQICGFSEKYTGALMSGKKGMSAYSFFTMVRCLALLPVFQHDQAQFERLGGRSDWSKIRRTGPRFRRRAKKFWFTSEFYREMGRKGAAERARRAMRSSAARKAAMARWSEQR